MSELEIEFAPDLPTVRRSAVVVVPVEVFAAVREASAEALLGTDDDTVLAAGGTAMLYGEGGAGKTTAEIDLAFHVAAGIPWLGLAVQRRARGLMIEAEGPRGKMRMKLAAKLAAWQGPTIDGWLAVVESPWVSRSLANPEHRAMLAQAIVDNDAEIVFAGPVAALGLEGGGTPAEVRAFVAHLEDIRARVGRPVAFVLIAHTNKGGQVSGAWEGATDTLAHASAQGHGKLRLHWQKARWAPTVHRHSPASTLARRRNLRARGQARDHRRRRVRVAHRGRPRQPRRIVAHDRSSRQGQRRSQAWSSRHAARNRRPRERPEGLRDEPLRGRRH